MLVMAAVFAGCGSDGGGSGEKGSGGAADARVKTVALNEKSDPASLVVGDGALWIALDGKLLEADPASGKIRRRIAIPVKGGPGNMAVDDETVWIVIFTRAKERLVGIDIESGKARGKPFAIPFAYPIEIVATGGFVWMASNLKGQRNLYRYDPKVGKFTKRIPGTGNRGLAGGADGLWLTSGDTLVKVDPDTARVAGGPYETAAGTSPVAVGEGVVWTATFDGTIERHDPASGDTIGENSGLVKLSDNLASGPLGTWIADSFEDRIIRLDPKTGDAAETIEGVDTQELAVGEDAIYAIAQGDEPSIYVITPGG
jgi:streptogramin lyase